MRSERGGRASRIARRTPKGLKRLNDEFEVGPRLTPEQVKLAVPNYYWWHTIDLGNGIVTPGQKSAELMEIEINGAFEGIDFTGKRVLDAGCWNGGFSVEAARRGAREVVGLDHDRPAIRHLKCSETFQLVADATGLPLKAVDVDLDAPRLSLDHLGKFDIVLFLGVFYHLRDPIAATRELAAIANEVLAIETISKTASAISPPCVFSRAPSSPTTPRIGGARTRLAWSNS